MSALSDLLIAICSDHSIGLPFLRRLRDEAELRKIQIARVNTLATAQNEFDAQQILAGQKHFDDCQLTLNGLPAIPTSSTYGRVTKLEPTLGDASVLRDVALESALDHLRRAKHVDVALCEAHALLSKDHGPAPSADIQSDWLFRWRAAAADVSDQDVITLLGQLLAGEVKQPGTFSYRSLSFLRTASSDDILAIRELCPLVFNRRYFWISTTDRRQKSLKDRIYFIAPHPGPLSIKKYVDLMTLGVMSPAGDAETALYWSTEPSPYMEIDYFGRKFHVSNATETKLQPPFQYLTPLGEELVDLISRKLELRPVEGYIESMLDEFKRYQTYNLEELPSDTSSKYPATGE